MEDAAVYLLSFLISWIGIFLIMFIISRIIAFLGKGKWIPFAKTTWKSDLYVSFVLSEIILVFNFF